jgi:dihydrodipicolinate synthase/N-acetylneuraminate lyase
MHVNRCGPSSEVLAVSGLEGVIPVLETPFTADGQLDRDAFGTLTQHVLAAGVSGVMFPGYASEMLKLDDRERTELISDLLAVTRVRPDITAVISVPDHATTHALRRAAQAVELGADAINVLPPYLLSPPRGEILDHVGHLLDAVAPLPVIVQFAPAQTGTALGVGELVELSRRHGNLAAVKVESNPPGRAISALTAAGIPALVGYAGLHLPDALRRGAIGVQPGSSFVEVYVELWRRWLAGDEVGCTDLHRRLLPYLSSWMQHVEHIVQVEKTISLARGLVATDSCRRPGYPLDSVEQDTVTRFLAEFSPWLVAAGEAQ